MCHESSAYDQESNSKCTFYGGCNSQASVMFIGLGTFQLDRHENRKTLVRTYLENQPKGSVTKQSWFSPKMMQGSG